MAGDWPELVQFGDLTPGHFDREPVWIQCHVVDYDEPWHDQTDEETFRPRKGPLPASPGEGTLLVRATLRLANGQVLRGFVTPTTQEEADVLGLPPIAGMQPNVFLPAGRREAFWDGIFERPAESRQQLYSELGLAAEAVFPIAFAAEAGLCEGLASGQLDGFYSATSRDLKVKVVR